MDAVTLAAARASILPKPVPRAAPLAPSSVVATAGPTQATVTWTPPAAPLGGHTVTASPGGASATVAYPVTSATITGLTNGTAYTFTVKATNAVGDSGASAASNSVTPTADPGGFGIPGCVAWWAADKLTGLSDGASVTSWPDASGNAFTAVQPTSPYTQVAPTYKASWTNSKPALTFDGNTASLITSLTSDRIGSRMTVFVVCDATAFNGDRRVLSDQTSSQDSSGNFIDTNASAWRVIWAGGQGNTPAAALTTPTVLSIIAPGFEYVSGTKNASSYVSPGLRRTAPWWIGALAANKNFPGRIAEVIFYGRALSDAERHQVESYLGTKYAITMAVQ